MKSSLRWTALMLATVVPGFCQAAAEQAAAIAGGGIGLVGGKPMSRAIDKVFTGVDTASGKAAKGAPATSRTKPVEPEKLTNAPVTVTGPGYGGSGNASTGGSSAPAARAAHAHSRKAPLVRKEVTPGTDEVQDVTPSREEAVVTVPDVGKIQEGMGRTQVLAMLGDPSYRVTIPDEGHLREVFGFSAGSRWLGTVRLDNGEVVRVETPR